MNVNTASFDIAYDSYYNAIKEAINKNDEILEIGGGAHPSINNRSDISYTIADPDIKELEKAPDDVIKIEGTAESLPQHKKYDIVISKMVLEHVENPIAFHSAILNLLAPDGVAIHFFACRHSLPSFMNRIFPESLGDFILKLLKNRDLDNSPKYEAYYKKTMGHTAKQLAFFDTLGYDIIRYDSFVGHKYFKSIPIIKWIERLYTKTLYKLNFYQLATVALVVIKKKK